MRSSLPTIALRLGIEERTLRRWVSDGTVRSWRPSPKGLEFAPGELQYLRDHRELIGDLKRALRTEPNVQLAVLYGSSARGDERIGSDVDVLVDFRSPASGPAFAHRLERAIGRSVDVADLARVREEAPLLLQRVLDEGRVLTDRGKLWPELQAERARIMRRAQRQMRAERRDAAESLESLMSGGA